MNLIQLSFKQNLFVICTMSLTVFAFGQNNLKQEEVNDNLIGKVVFLENEISLSQNKNTLQDKVTFYFSYSSQENSVPKNKKTIDFMTSQEAFESIFNQAKEVFKSKVPKEVSLDQNVKMRLEMITNTDIQFRFYKGSNNQGVFSVSPTGLHLLFGKEWNKSLWYNYLAD